MEWCRQVGTHRRNLIRSTLDGIQKDFNFSKLLFPAEGIFASFRFFWLWFLEKVWKQTFKVMSNKFWAKLCLCLLFLLSKHHLRPCFVQHANGTARNTYIRVVCEGDRPPGFISSHRNIIVRRMPGSNSCVNETAFLIIPTWFDLFRMNMLQKSLCLLGIMKLRRPAAQYSHSCKS
jgi:hypothetical protein